MLNPQTKDIIGIIDQALSEGDNRNVDMIVEDIYGSGVGLEKSGLNKDQLASSFGKASQHSFDKSNLADIDKARSLLNILAINIGQLSWLYSDMYGCEEILVLGNVLDHPGFNYLLNVLIKFIIQSALVNFSGKKKSAIFVKNSEYSGAIGQLIY